MGETPWSSCNTTTSQKSVGQGLNPPTSLSFTLLWPETALFMAAWVMFTACMRAIIGGRAVGSTFWRSGSIGGILFKGWPLGIVGLLLLMKKKLSFLTFSAINSTLFATIESLWPWRHTRICLSWSIMEASPWAAGNSSKWTSILSMSDRANCYVGQSSP